MTHQYQLSGLTCNGCVATVRKELLTYDEMTLSEIAFKLGYSNVAYLSNQFKKITGFTPSHFKQLKDKNRQSLEKV